MKTLLQSSSNMMFSKINGGCPCGSGEQYSACCGPLHAGSKAAKTAEALMRARYSAFVVGDENFLQKSWHSSTRPSQVLEKDADKTHWLGLNIVDCVAGGENDSDGSVEFIARFELHKQAGQLHEVSSFRHEHGQWYYVDGKTRKGQTIRSDKIGRNGPCPCGSGKKYKKCCGK